MTFGDKISLPNRHEVTHPGAGRGSQVPPEVKCPGPCTLRCCSDSLQCPACSYEVTPWQMLSLWHISSACKRYHWNNSCQRKMALECYCQGILGIPHLLSFKSTLEAFLEIIQSCLIERSWNFSWGILDPAVHSCQYRQWSWPAGQTNPRTHRHKCPELHICRGNTAGKAQHPLISLFLGDFPPKSLRNSILTSC